MCRKVVFVVDMAFECVLVDVGGASAVESPHMVPLMAWQVQAM